MYLLGVRPSSRHLEAVLEVARSVGSTLELDELLARIVSTVTRRTGAERSTLFLVDAATGELWSRVAEGTGTLEIRLPPGRGIAGWVAQHGEPVVLADAYRDERFSREWDRATGYRTRALLAAPLRNPAGRTVGVMQCLNKPRGFTKADRELLDTVGSLCAVALENAFLVRRLDRANQELQILVDLERAVSAAPDEGAVLRDALRRLCTLFGSPDASALLVGNVPHVLSLSNGQFHAKRISPEWAQVLLDRFGAPLRADDADRHVVSAPLEAGGERLGALQVVHAAEAGDGGVRVLGLVAARVGPAIGRLREQAAKERQARLSLVGQMMSSLLHDLRTPISAVAGYAELMAEEDDPAARASFARRVRVALEQIEEMTQEVLQFARGEHGLAVREVELAAFVDATVQVVRAELGRFDATVEVEGEIAGTVRLDAGKLRRVVSNLARNAGQAGARRVVWRLARADGRLLLELHDDGHGISEEVRERLFQPFATFGKQGGTGLGLAMARRVVEAHGGTIEVESEPGRGTVFRIALPPEPPAGRALLG